MLLDALYAVQFALGIVFGLAAGGKLRDPRGFARGVADFHIVPAWLVYPSATLIIVTEAWLAVAHFTGWHLAVSAVLAIGMLTTFAAAVGINLRRGRRVPCHCFGGGGRETISGQTLARLSMLLLGEAFLLSGSTVLAPHRSRAAPVSDGPELVLMLFWAPLLLVAGSWFLSLPDLISVLWAHRIEKRRG